jgi:hypothetical protein
MTDHTEFVALWVTKVRAKVVLVILGPQTRSPLRSTAIGECDFVGARNDGSTFRQKGDHLPVPAFVRLLIEGLSNEEQRPRTRMRLPTGPRAAWVAEANCIAKRGHQRVVESYSAFEIANAYEDVGEHA